MTDSLIRLTAVGLAHGCWLIYQERLESSGSSGEHGDAEDGEGDEEPDDAYEGRGFAPSSLPNPAKIAADLGSMCSSEIEPPLRPLIGIHQFEGEQVVVAEIPELDPAQRPCFYIGAGTLPAGPDFAAIIDRTTP